MQKAKKFIIVVDDDKAVLDSLKFALKLEGLDVHVCEDATSLLKYPGLDEAECLVLDYRMQELDGFALLAALTAPGISTPAILVTAPVSSDLRRRAGQAGFFRVLEKPLLDNVLLDSVHAAMG